MFAWVFVRDDNVGERKEFPFLILVLCFSLLKLMNSNISLVCVCLIKIVLWYVCIFRCTIYLWHSSILYSGVQRKLDMNNQVGGNSNCTLVNMVCFSTSSWQKYPMLINSVICNLFCSLLSLFTLSYLWGRIWLKMTRTWRIMLSSSQGIGRLEWMAHVSLCFYYMSYLLVSCGLDQLFYLNSLKVCNRYKIAFCFVFGRYLS